MAVPPILQGFAFIEPPSELVILGRLALGFRPFGEVVKIDLIASRPGDGERLYQAGSVVPVQECGEAILAGVRRFQNMEHGVVDTLRQPLGQDFRLTARGPGGNSIGYGLRS